MYHYDALGDERFQEFCQALITATFPTTQCLPVGQPDGGRDAYVVSHFLRQRRNRPTEPEVIVFQVKHIKNPSDSRSERDMIEEIVRSEKDKVERLKALGLKKYFLITNLKGTAHLEVGSIDKVHKLLSELLEIEAYCWWRDDLDRRLDNNSSVKWSYPEILKATDLLQKLVEGQLGEDEERRRGAVRAYMTAQYKDDQELKFKQTELRSTMAELFVDLPMQMSASAMANEENSRRFRRRRPRAATWDQYDYVVYPGDDSLHAAEFFIASKISAEFDKIVLEGAPGQGKSTVTQYVCQALRTKLLNRSGEMAGFPKYCQDAPVRIPFRVDLRDLAKWISGVDPFQPKQPDLPAHEPLSLEGFLAGQVRFLSGGHDFNVSDLTAVARASHIFLALDGFDEVADIELRQKLVEEISKGTHRLAAAGTFSLQTIVTSRPAAFAKSVRFPTESWTYFELLPLERRNVEEYSQKWMRAKGLRENEQTQLLAILDTKLKESHTQYLAKNPMQLTILLSLINSRGASLPEKRTALYDAYMEMFFSRESEKSDIVRDNRDILIDIHRFLAWKLQTSAESGENGSIDQLSLRTTLFTYLYNEAEDTTIVEALFDGMIERVGALVSRVQGTYEFEVQPLREYFAARHLYETAPYPVMETDGAGDKLDRFNALVRNPYWLNVARFYGGCFNKGEIMTLVNELMGLSDDDLVRLTSHPRSFALMLLSDWVFSQYQPAVKAVINFITQKPQFLQLLANSGEDGPSYWSGLPDRSGRIEFLTVLWSYAIQADAPDQVRALARAICENSPLSERVEKWSEAQGQMSARRWVLLGEALEIFASRPPITIEVADAARPAIIEAFLRAQQFNALERSGRFEAARDALLHRVIPRVSVIDKDEHGRLAWLSTQMAGLQYRLVFREEAGLPLQDVIARRVIVTRSRKHHEIAILDLGTDQLPDEEGVGAKAYLLFLQHETAMLATNLQPWVDLVEAWRRVWGDCRAIDRIAFLAAGARSNDESGLEGELENTTDLVRTARFIRRKSGAPKWWTERLEKTDKENERRRLLLLMALWATPRTILKMASVVDQTLQSLSEENWSFLMADIVVLVDPTGRRDERPTLTTTELKNLSGRSPRLLTLIGQKVAASTRWDLALTIAGTEALGGPERQFAYRTFWESISEPNTWSRALPHIQELYFAGVPASPPLRRDVTMPAESASAISSEPARYPLRLVALAETVLRSIAGEKAPKLMEIAERDRWFRNPPG